MKRTFAVLLSLGLGIGALPASALARVAANVPVDSHYYETIDKLSESENRKQRRCFLTGRSKRESFSQ